MKLNHRTSRVAVTLTILVLLAAYPFYLAIAANLGPNNAGAGIDVDNGGLTAWTNPGGITAAGFPWATASVPLQSSSHYLQATQYGFAIPVGSTINGITVDISRMSDGGELRLIRDSQVSLVKGGMIVGDNKAKLNDNWSLGVLATATYGGTADLWGTTWTPAEINAGNFGVVLSVFNSSNTENRLATVDTIKVTIEYAPPSSTTTVNCGAGMPEVTYGSSISCVATVMRTVGENTPTGTVNWISDGPGNFNVGSCILSGLDGTSTCSVTYTPTMVGTGTHLITATYTGDANFTISNGSQGVTVNKRLVTVAANPTSKFYGDVDPELTYQITSGSLVGTDNFTGELSRVAGEDFGTYAILKNTLALPENYTLVYTGADLTIMKRPVTVTADPASKTYGEADPTFIYHITSGELVGSDNFTGALGRAPGEDIGNYAIQLGSLVITDNYNLSLISANLTITKRPVVVQADATSKVYGEPDPGFTYEITSGSLKSGDSFSGSLSRTAGVNVGKYPILQGSLALSANYNLTFLSADLTILKRPVTITADAISKAWGEPDPQLTFQVTAGSVVSGDLFTGALSRLEGEEIGAYPIARGSVDLSSNYDLTFVGANFSIIKATPTLSVTNSPVLYSGSPQAAVVIASVDGTITNILYNGLPTPPTDVGTYAVTADFTPTDAEHYNALTAAVAGNFIITDSFRLFLPVINR